MKHLLVFILFISVCQRSMSQYKVCGGSKETYWITVVSGSIYKWRTALGKGNITENINKDTITVFWENSIGNDTLFVQEITSSGCDRAKAQLIVERVLPSAAIVTKEQQLCFSNSGLDIGISLISDFPAMLVVQTNNATDTIKNIMSKLFLYKTIPLFFDSKFKLLSIIDKNGCAASLSDQLKIDVLSKLNTIEIIPEK